MPTILVTGGAGFIGSHVIDKLLDRGDTVLCVDNFNDYYSTDQKEENISHNLTNPKFKLYKVDITDGAALGIIFDENKIDGIVHLAARAGVRPSLENPKLYYDVNVMGTLNLLELAKEKNIINFVLASSSSVYGNRKDVPFKETDNVDNPISPYAATKKAIEEMSYVYHSLYKINIMALRFFTVYGPRGRPDMAPFIFTKAVREEKEIPLFGDGSAKRDFTYVDDITDGVIAAIDNNTGYEVVNLGNSNPIKVTELISAIEKATGKKAKIKNLPKQPGDVDLTYASIDKAKKLLGYNPKVKIEEGITNFVKWLK